VTEVLGKPVKTRPKAKAKVAAKTAAKKAVSQKKPSAVDSANVASED
jgi:hypothetical protein